MVPDQTQAKIAEAASSFSAVLHTEAYAETHSDAAQLARLRASLSPAHGQVILDLGTGNGYVAMAIAGADPMCKVVGVDVAVQAIAQDLEQARTQGLSNVEFLGYDGIMLPFANDHFDAAVCRYAFHHLPRPDTSLDELRRTVRGSGKLVLSDAIRAEADDLDFINHFQEIKRDGHVRIHHRTDLIDLVCRHGFEVIEVFESSISFTRERGAAYDALLAATPERVLKAYSVVVEEQQIRLRLRILNAVFLNRKGHDQKYPNAAK